MTLAVTDRAAISPRRLASDLRWPMTATAQPHRLLGTALSEVVGGPVGLHAMIGPARILTPLE